MDDLKEIRMEDLPILNKWFRQWDKPEVSFMELPTVGLMYKDMAAGFLTRTDAEVGLLEYYIVDKDAPKEERSLGLKKITEKLITYAKSDYLTKIIAITNNPAIFKYCEHFGFKDLGPSHVFVRGL